MYSSISCYFFISFYRPETLVVKCGRYLESNPFSGIEFSLERLHHLTISHDKANSKRWCQWPELLITYRTINFCYRYRGARNLSVSMWVQEFKFSHPMQIFYMVSQLYQGWLIHTFIRPRQFLNSGPVDAAIDALTIRTLGAQIVNKRV